MFFFSDDAERGGMDRSELFDVWQANKYRPAVVRQYREEIHDHTNTSDEIPDGSLFDVRQWLRRYRGTVTRQLSDGENGKDTAPERGDRHE